MNTDFRIIDLRAAMAERQREYDEALAYADDVRAGRFPDPICSYEAENGFLPGENHGLDIQMRAR